MVAFECGKNYVDELKKTVCCVLKKIPSYLSGYHIPSLFAVHAFKTTRIKLATSFLHRVVSITTSLK